MLFKPGLRRYVLAPLLVNILVFSCTAWIGSLYFEQFIEWALPQNSWLHFLQWLLWPLFALAYLMITFYTFTLVANLIGAPFNSILAEKVETQLKGQPLEEHEHSLWAEIIPAILGETGKIGYFLTRAVPVLILMIIPGINVLGSVLWLLLGFWFLSIEYVDYPLGNHSIRPKAQRSLLRKRPFQSWCFGASANLLMLIPIINFAAMPASVIGATLFWNKQLETVSKQNH